MSSNTNTQSLKEAQRTALQRMLATSKQKPQNGGGYGASLSMTPALLADQWKIFIYDLSCRAIVSPQMSVSALRKEGVTLHLQLEGGENAREAIEDVPAVYFCRPTVENLKIIASDLERSLYSRVHLNFVTKLQRSEMEYFAKLVVQTGSLGKVASVHDQYIDYVCLEDRMFTLNKTKSYVQYNKPNQTDAAMELIMDDICYGLISVVSTLGALPIIRCPRGGAPEMVARKLNRMITEQSAIRNVSNLSRPLLVIMDRNSDLITPLQHTSTYQALVDDVLQHSSNRVSFVIQDKNTDGKTSIGQNKTYDLDADTDPFYSKYKFSPFPEAIEMNGSELAEVTRKEKDLRSKTTTSTNSSSSTTYEDSSGTSQLASAVESLPALLGRKKQLEIHTSILSAVMNEVAARDVPVFYELENSFATGVYKNDMAKGKKAVLDIISDSSKGNIDDKVRLLSVFALSSAPSSDIDHAIATLRQLGVEGEENGADIASKIEAGVKAIEYLKKLRAMHMISAISFSNAEPTYDQGASFATLGNFMANQATGLLAKASDRVGTLLGKIHKHNLTCVVENLCDRKLNSEDETFLYLDPKVKGDVDVNALRGLRAPVKEAIAFVIGGGCYSEYQNLQLISNDNLKVTYGSTELVDPTVFLSQLAELS